MFYEKVSLRFIEGRPIYIRKLNKLKKKRIFAE